MEGQVNMTVRQVFNNTNFEKARSYLLYLVMATTMVLFLAGMTKIGIEAQSRHVAEIVSSRMATVPDKHDVAAVAFNAMSMHNAEP